MIPLGKLRIKLNTLSSLSNWLAQRIAAYVSSSGLASIKLVSGSSDISAIAGAATAGTSKRAGAATAGASNPAGPADLA